MQALSRLVRMVGRWMAAVSELPACAAGRVALVAAQAVCKDLPAELERGAWKGRVPVRASVAPVALVWARASGGGG